MIGLSAIEQFERLNELSKTRVLTDPESYALERLVRTKEIIRHMDAKRNPPTHKDVLP